MGSIHYTVAHVDPRQNGNTVGGEKVVEFLILRYKDMDEYKEHYAVFGDIYDLADFIRLQGGAIEPLAIYQAKVTGVLLLQDEKEVKK